MAIFRNSLTDVAHSRGDLIDYSALGTLFTNRVRSSSSWFGRTKTTTRGRDTRTPVQGRGDRARISSCVILIENFSESNRKKTFALFDRGIVAFQTSITRARETTSGQSFPPSQPRFTITAPDCWLAGWLLLVA